MFSPSYRDDGHDAGTASLGFPEEEPGEKRKGGREEPGKGRKDAGRGDKGAFGREEQQTKERGCRGLAARKGFGAGSLGGLCCVALGKTLSLSEPWLPSL